jgi:hypothetical protein
MAAFSNNRSLSASVARSKTRAPSGCGSVSTCSYVEAELVMLDLPRAVALVRQEFARLSG